MLRPTASMNFSITIFVCVCVFVCETSQCVIFITPRMTALKYTTINISYGLLRLPHISTSTSRPARTITTEFGFVLLVHVHKWTHDKEVHVGRGVYIWSTKQLNKVELKLLWTMWCELKFCSCDVNCASIVQFWRYEILQISIPSHGHVLIPSYLVKHTNYFKLPGPVSPLL